MSLGQLFILIPVWLRLIQRGPLKNENSHLLIQSQAVSKQSEPNQVIKKNLGATNLHDVVSESND